MKFVAKYHVSITGTLQIEGPSKANASNQAWEILENLDVDLPAGQYDINVQYVETKEAKS